MDFKNLEDEKIYSVVLEMSGKFAKEVMALRKHESDDMVAIFASALSLYRVVRETEIADGKMQLVLNGKRITMVIP